MGSWEELSSRLDWFVGRINTYAGSSSKKLWKKKKTSPSYFGPREFVNSCGRKNIFRTTRKIPSRRTDSYGYVRVEQIYIKKKHSSTEIYIGKPVRRTLHVKFSLSFNERAPRALENSLMTRELESSGVTRAAHTYPKHEHSYFEPTCGFSVITHWMSNVCINNDQVKG